METIFWGFAAMVGLVMAPRVVRHSVASGFARFVWSPRSPLAMAGAGLAILGLGLNPGVAVVAGCIAVGLVAHSGGVARKGLVAVVVLLVAAIGVIAEAQAGVDWVIGGVVIGAVSIAGLWCFGRIVDPNGALGDHVNRVRVVIVCAMIVSVAVSVESYYQGALMAAWEAWSMGMIWSWLAFAALVVAAKSGLFKSQNTGNQDQSGGGNTRELSDRESKEEGIRDWWKNMEDEEMWSVMNSKNDRICF